MIGYMGFEPIFQWLKVMCITFMLIPLNIRYSMKNLSVKVYRFIVSKMNRTSILILTVLCSTVEL